MSGRFFIQVEQNFHQFSPSHLLSSAKKWRRGLLLHLGSIRTLLLQAILCTSTTSTKISFPFCLKDHRRGKMVRNSIISDAPSPRIGSAIATDNENVYIFGGKEEANRLNDLWSFSLSDYKFQRLKDEGEIPAVRNGHTMNYS
jgi:hypothetical protein